MINSSIPSSSRSSICRPLALCALSLALAVGLSACGKKPKALDPPQGWEGNTFPRSYPAPEGGPPAKTSKKPEITPNLGIPNAGSDNADSGDTDTKNKFAPLAPIYGNTLSSPSNLPYPSSSDSPYQ